MKYSGLVLLCGGVWLTQFWTARRALAIPPFVRKYEGTSCTTCHVLPPKLNAFGRAFRNLGYRMPENDESLATQKPVPLGAPAWKKVWPKGVWPSSIPGGQFVGIALNTNFEVNPSKPVTNEFDGIDQFTLLLGGSVGESFSFFGVLNLVGREHVSEVGRVFLQYNSPQRYFNVRVGQFEPRVAPFSDHLRINGQESYLQNVFPILATGNLFGFSPHQRGIELWGAREGVGKKGGLLWSIGVLNGEFGGAAESLRDSSAGNLVTELEEARKKYGGRFDVNSEKDYYAQVSYKLGGMGVFGSGGEKILRSAKEWRDNSVALGGYFYRGTAGAFLEQDGGRRFFNSGDRFYRTGLSFDAWLYDLNLFGGWQRNHDRLRNGRTFDIDVTMVEADYVLPWPWVQPTVRFEHVRPSSGPEFSRWSLNTSLMIRANVILTLDALTTSKNAPDLPLFDDRFRAGLRFYF